MFSKQHSRQAFVSCKTQHVDKSSVWLPCSCSTGVEDDKTATLLSNPNTFALAVFTHLLPDTGVKLFKQHADDAFTQFSLFGFLPEELRILVWRAAFPRNRTVQVELNPGFAILHSHTPPPVSLHINRESRAETLRFYTSLLDPSPRRPIFFHPALDTVYFHRRYNGPLEFMQSTAYLTSRSLAGIAKIQSLKIPKMYYGGQMQGWIKFGTPRRSLYGYGNFVEPDRGGLRFFHGLEELILVSHKQILDSANHLEFVNRPDAVLSLPPDMVFTLNTEERIEEYTEAFKRFFEWEREKNPECKVPEIVVRQARNPRNDRWYLGRLSELLR